MISASAAAASSARPQNHSEGSRHSSISSTSATAATTSASTAIPSASFKTDYFGFALLQSADGPELVAESEQAVAAVLGKRVKPVRMELSISGSGLALVSSDGLRVAHIPLEELRSLSRHRDGKSGKPKVLTFMALSHYPGTERMGFQCYIARMETTADAVRVSEFTTAVCNLKAQELAMQRKKQLESGDVTKLPKSNRVVKVGWS